MGSKTCRAIDVVLYRHSVEFYYRTSHSGKDSSKPFETIGNYDIGVQIAKILEELDHDVEYIDETDEG